MITVFTSSYNHAQYLNLAIESVLNQTYEDFEYILVSDGCCDYSYDMMQEFASQDKRIRVFELPKQTTVGHLINFSVSKASGEYWVWAPADDILDPKLLETKDRVSDDLPNHIIYHSYDIINEAGVFSKRVNIPCYEQDELYKIVWEKAPLAFTGIWIPMNLLRVAPFPEHLKFSEDYWWLIMATKCGFKFHGISYILHQKRQHGKTLTSINKKKMQQNVLNIRRELRDK